MNHDTDELTAAERFARYDGFETYYNDPEVEDDD